MPPESEGHGQRVFELSGLQYALQQGVCCNRCGTGSISLKEDLSKQQGLFTAPYLCCDDCSNITYIPFTTVGSRKILTINRQSVFAARCIGGTYSSLAMFCAMFGLPSPIARRTYTTYVKEITRGSVEVAETSLKQAREEVREISGATSDDDIVDIVISCDGTWQKRGFSSLFGVVFIIAHLTGKVIDYHVMSKHCSACQHWETRDKHSDEYKRWKEDHECDINFSGSSPAMEPHGTLQLFMRSLQHRMRYKNLISDGDSKSYVLLQREEPYGPDHPVIKLDCVGHVQKRMGTALRNLKTKYRGQKLDDGKTIGGVGRLTDDLINSLQNYYGTAIRCNRGNLQGMVRAVQASLLHCNSTDENLRHHLCPEGTNSWCKWQKAKAQGKVYQHKRKPIPECIVLLIKPIYARLGDPALLQKCLHGFTQNANESLHSTLWKFCPKVLFMGKNNVEMACALATISFNDGSASLVRVSDQLQLKTTPHCKKYLRRKDRLRVKKSITSSSAHGKQARRAARRRRKGFEGKKKDSEGVMYSAGTFDTDIASPGPSKRPKN